MTDPIIWTPPRSAMSRNFDGLLDKMVRDHKLVDVDEAGFVSFQSAPGNRVVLLLEEPDKVAESWDMAVIFPDLLATTCIRPPAALSRPQHSAKFQARFGVKRMPALLFLRDGVYVGVVEGLRDWNELVAEFNAMLQAPVSRAPSIGIAVTSAASGCH